MTAQFNRVMAVIGMAAVSIGDIDRSGMTVGELDRVNKLLKDIWSFVSPDEEMPRTSWAEALVQSTKMRVP